MSEVRHSKKALKEEKIRHIKTVTEKTLKGEIELHKVINRGDVSGTKQSSLLTVLSCPH